MQRDKIPYLYIAGASFSGSTLLAFLLNAHPQMVSVSEVCGVLPHELIEGLETYRCSCGERLLECPFYRRLARRIHAQGSSFDLRDWQTHFQLADSRWIQLLFTRPLAWGAVEALRNATVRLLPAARARQTAIAQRNVHFARATLEVSGKRLFVDAQKDPARVHFLSRIPQIDLHVIHLIRDARAGTASYMKHNPRNDAERGARRWRNANVTADHARRHVRPERFMRLRYDDLCADPNAVIDRIADFASVPRGPVPVDFYAAEHHIVGNQMRLGASSQVRPDNSWRERLSDEQVDTIRRVAASANRKFGFDWP